MHHVKSGAIFSTLSTSGGKLFQLPGPAEVTGWCCDDALFLWSAIIPNCKQFNIWKPGCYNGGQHLRPRVLIFAFIARFLSCIICCRSVENVTTLRDYC